MPQIPISTENRVGTSRFPTLKLEYDERARVVLLDKDPTMEFVHTIRAPSISDGQVVMEKVKTKSGDDEERVKMDFIGRPLCLGDFDTVRADGIDPKRCPVCEASQDSDALAAPERRYAVNIGRYATRPGSFAPSSPFQLSILAWVFADKIFNQLVDFQEEWGDLRQHDLNCGPCQQKQFQKFDIAVAKEAVWMLNDATKKLTAQIYAENKCTSLEELIGRKSERNFMAEDVRTAILRHKRAFGSKSSSTADAALSTEATAEAANFAPSTTEVESSLDLGGLLDSIDTPAMPEPPRQPDTTASDALAEVKEEAATPEPPRQTAEAPADTLDLSDLLNI
jgi:hypothetical protein